MTLISRQTALKRLHLEHMGMSSAHVRVLLTALMQSETAYTTIEELYLQGSRIDKEVNDGLLEFINSATSLKILDIRGKGKDPLNFQI